MLLSHFVDNFAKIIMPNHYEDFLRRTELC